MREHCKDEAGVAAIEYALLAALIAAVIVLVVGEVGQKVLGSFMAFRDAFP